MIGPNQELRVGWEQQRLRVGEWRNQSRDLARRSELNARVSEEARWDLEELKSSCRTVKKRRACPAGTTPAELWTMLLHAPRNLSPAGLGIGYQRKRIEPVRTLSLLERLLCRVRSSGAAPLAWHHSSGAPLHKSNKAGQKGKRVVHVLPSMGKQFFKVLLRTRRDGWTPPAPADWLHGYILGMRRESAVLIRQATTWRLERLGLKVTHSLSRSDQRLWVSQVGGDGSRCGGASGPEPSSGTAEVQTGDHNDSRQ